jgi:hypothetical protein
MVTVLKAATLVDDVGLSMSSLMSFVSASISLVVFVARYLGTGCTCRRFASGYLGHDLLADHPGCAWSAYWRPVERTRSGGISCCSIRIVAVDRHDEGNGTATATRSEQTIAVASICFLRRRNAARCR